MTQTYPGSTTPVGTAPEPSTSMRPEEILEGLRARRVQVGGQEVVMYGIGELATALGRKSVTMRKWEEVGIIPVATFMLNPGTEQGRRRMYSAAQVIGIVRIAAEEGILYAPRNAIKDTQFVGRVQELFGVLTGAAA